MSFSSSQSRSKSFRPRVVFVILILVVAFTQSFAQDRCGTVEYTNKLKSQKKVIESTEQFEEWLQTKVQSLSRQKKNQRQQAATYQIPVVVHVIHNGEAEGTGTNISTAQILSQLNVLNKDYKRLNTDASSTPPLFASVAGAFDVDFVLAKQNPEGLATTGIVRVQGTKTQWTMDDNYELKSLSYWPAEDYLNLWVCNITDYLGYSQFPVSTLPGLENSSTNRLTDGVVIYYKSFGSEDDGSFDLDDKYNKGRTATHEIGHFFGLRHIWGDDEGACGNVGDYVADTPDQASSTGTCPVHPKSDNCTAAKMFQNYMDYTDDVCMNLFTEDQVARMTVVLENSVRRVSLLTSHALNDPQPVANDAGIKEIMSPLASECSGQLTPSVEVRNYGNNTITSVSIRLKIGAATIETINPTLNLDELQSSVINFSPQTLTPGNKTYSFEILLTNGVADGNPSNNLATVQVFTPQVLTPPFLESFTTLPPSWTVVDLDNFISWEFTNAPKESPSNKAMMMNFYAYEDGEGELDLLITPTIDLSTIPIAVLNFDVAYARFQSSNDGLRVYVLTNCNQNIFDGTLIYEKRGSSLATTASSNVGFVPQGASDWRTESMSLQPFIGLSNVQLAFVGVNDWGNNLYLDNVAVLTDELEDIAVGEITPSFITCDDTPQLKVVVQNVGTVVINDFDVNMSVDGVTTTTSISNLTLLPGQSTQVTLVTSTFLTGNNNVLIELVNPNGVPDVNTSNNEKEVSLILNMSSASIPYFEDFENFSSDEWIVLNPTNGMEWETKSTSVFGTSLYFNAFDNSVEGDKSWLISPVLDFSSAAKASLQFYTSYAKRSSREDGLQVFYSLDCGNSFEPTPLYDEKGEALSPIESSGEWEPETVEDWEQKFEVLNFLVGQKTLRFAFVVTNHNGNDLYLDNINFNTTDEPSPLVEDDELYIIYNKNDDLYITFNLPESQTVMYEVVDTMGRQLVRSEITDVLKQTWPISLDPNAASGVYIVRLGIGNHYYSTKIYVSH